MKTGDSVMFKYNNKMYAGIITRINLQVSDTIIYNIRCGEGSQSSEFEIWKNKEDGSIIKTVKL